MNCFFKFKFFKIFDELNVEDVTKIFFNFFIFSNFLINGIILCNSPTLAPWNQINFPVTFFLENKQNFSLNLFLSSFFFN